MNGWTWILSQVKQRKEKKSKKERKKEEEEKDCWERPLCLTLLAGLIEPIVKGKEKKEKENVFF